MHWPLQQEDISRAGVERRGGLFHWSILKWEALIEKFSLVTRTMAGHCHHYRRLQNGINPYPSVFCIPFHPVPLPSCCYLPADADLLVSRAGNAAWLWQRSLTFFCSSPGWDLPSGWSQLDGVSLLLKFSCSGFAVACQKALTHIDPDGLVVMCWAWVWPFDTVMGLADSEGQHPWAGGSWQIDSFSWI